jgi:hypothetical protein
VVHALRTRRGNSLSLVPVPRSGLCAPFVGSVFSAAVAGSKALPATDRVVTRHHAIFFGQVLRRQCRPESFLFRTRILLPDQTQQPVPKFRGFATIGNSTLPCCSTAAASVNFSSSVATRPITSTRSPLLIAVLFNKTSSGWRSQSKATLLLSL